MRCERLATASVTRNGSMPSASAWWASIGLPPRRGNPIAPRRDPAARRRRPSPTPDEELLDVAWRIADDVRGIKIVVYVWAGANLVVAFVALMAVLLSN